MKCKIEIKRVEPAAPVWTFPCFARSNVGKKAEIVWARSSFGRDKFSGILVEGEDLGYCSCNWSVKHWTPVPAEESAGWRVIIDSSGVRLERPEAKPQKVRKPEYPWLGRWDTGVAGTVLFLGPDTALCGKDCVGWEGESAASHVPQRAFTPCAGSVTITNRPGVEFPRLYRMKHGTLTLRTAPDEWWYVAPDKGSIQRAPVHYGTDWFRLKEDPKDEPLPDGTSVTLTFEQP